LRPARAKGAARIACSDIFWIFMELSRADRSGSDTKFCPGQQFSSRFGEDDYFLAPFSGNWRDMEMDMDAFGIDSSQVTATAISLDSPVTPA